MKKNSILNYIIVLIIFVLAFIAIFPGTKVSASAQSNDLFKNFTSSNIILFHPDSNSVLYAKNENEKRQVASICKLMTTLITLEKIEQGSLKLDDEITASSYAASMEGSQAFLDAGSTYKVSDLLKSVIVASANDSAVALAEAISGNEETFTTIMNNRAQELKMTNTLYANSTGLASPNQYSTALDTAKLLKEVGKHELFNSDSKIWMDNFVHPSGRVTELVNTNRLIRYYDKTLNGKTGFTDEAGYCLSSTATNGNINLIAVTLNSKSAKERFSETQDLFNYGFANYESKQVLNIDAPVTNNFKVQNAKNGNIVVKPIQNYSVLSKRGENSNITLKYEYNKKLSAPLNEGAVVGKCLVVNNGVVMAEIDLVVEHKVEKENYNDIVNKLSKNWSFNF